MAKKKLITLILIVLAQYGFAQEKTPLISGTVKISTLEGTLECQLKISDMPHAEDYVILINSGLNLQYARNSEGYTFAYERIHDDAISDEAAGYYLPDNTGKAKFLPKSVEFKYVGKYPVVSDMNEAPRRGDWKGNIAFNKYSVRMDGRQTAWYPILYDIKKDKRYYKVRYDINIECEDCVDIYMNGNAPVMNASAHFKSDKPNELFLFAGTYVVSNYNGTYFLNPDISNAQIKAFGEITNRIKKFYESKLNIQYTDTITYVHTTPISKENAWMFVCYPTIVCVGHNEHGMKAFFGEDSSRYKTFIAHELGHYYFGNYRIFNSESGDVYSEGFSEYLSYKATDALFGESVYNAKLKHAMDKVKDFQPVALGNIKSENDYADRELYVYNYAPLIFTAIEKEVGMKVMWKWLNLILTIPTELTDYTFLQQCLSTAVNDEAKLKLIKEQYLDADSSLVNAVNRLKQ